MQTTGSFRSRNFKDLFDDDGGDNKETKIEAIGAVKQEFIVAQRTAKEVPFFSKIGEDKTLVFMATNRQANRLAMELVRRGYRAMSVGRDVGLLQDARRAIIDNFNAGLLRILVCSGVEPRELDVNGVGHIINYDLPRKKMDLEQYLLRIEHTAQRGDLKRVTSLFDKHDDNGFADYYAKCLCEAGQPVPRFFDPHLREYRRDESGQVKPLLTKEEEDAAAEDADDILEHYEF